MLRHSISRTQLVARVLSLEVLNELMTVAVEILVQLLQQLLQLHAHCRWVCSRECSDDTISIYEASAHCHRP